MSTTRKFLVSTAVALTALIGAVATADAKSGKGGGCCKGGGPHWHHRHHRHFFTPLYVTSGPGCGWLWRRYLNTGNPSYKWRYYECIGE